MTGRIARVKASAGSGKTWSLTTRFLRLLRAGVRPETILAATFTRKAAGEILGRVLARLAAGAASDADRRELAAAIGDPGLDSAACRALLVAVVRTIDRLSIGTLDSFFHRVARSYRLELDLPRDATLTDEAGAEAEALRAQALNDVIAQAAAAGTLDELLGLVTQFHGGAWKAGVTDALDELRAPLYDAWREAPAAAAWSRLPAPAGLLPQDRVERLAAELAAAAADDGTKRADAALKIVTAAREGRWDEVFETTLAEALYTGHGTYARARIPEALRRPGEPLVRHAGALVLKIQAERARAYHELARRFGERFDALRHAAGVLLYGDLPRHAGRLAAERPLEEIDARLDGRIEHLLLDEFQDTNPAQWQILRRFAQRIADDPARAMTFFTVGDRKQSIYGWRGAVPEIFETLEQDLAGLEGEEQVISRRSSPVVLAAVDAVLGALPARPAAATFPEAAARWDRHYVPHRAFDAARPGHVVLRTAPRPDENDAGAGPLRTAARIAADLHGRAPGRSIGVLVRNNAAIRTLLFELEQAGVPASGEGSIAIADEPAVEAILSAFEFADHPGATVAAYHVSHTPLAGHLLPGWRAGDVLDAGRRAALARAVRARVARDGYGSVVAEWAACLAPWGDARGARRLAQLVELADAYDARATPRPSDFVAHAESARAEEPLAARVRVLTVHKAKGLEFDAVILPDLDGALVRNDAPLVLDRPDPTGPVVAVYPRFRQGLRFLAPAVADAAEREKVRAQVEALCVFYVALTRARHALHLVVAPLESAMKNGQKQPALNPGGLRPALLAREGLGAAGETDGGGQVLYTSGDPEWFAHLAPVAAVPAAEPALQAPAVAVASGPARRARRFASPSGRERGGAVSAAELLRRTDPSGRRFGVLIHAFFAEVRYADDPAPDDGTLLRAARRALAESGDGDGDRRFDEAFVRQQIAAFREILARPGVRQALARPTGPCELLVEAPFAALVGGELLRGRFDRVVLHLDPSRRARQADVLDFKTDRVSPATVGAIADGYRPQLEAYRAALSAMLALPQEFIRSSLLFTATGDRLLVL